MPIDEQCWQDLMADRKERMAKFLSMDAPDKIICAEARMILEAEARGEFRAIRKMLRRWLAGKVDDIEIAVLLFWWEKVLKLDEHEVDQRIVSYSYSSKR